MMKKNIQILFMAFVLAACGAPAATQVAMEQPATEVLLATPTVQPTNTQVVLIASTSTLEIPSPTQQVAQAVIVPTFTPLPPPQAGTSNEIKFDTGGTWKDTQDSVPAGGSKIYTLNAMLGQVMSVSITGGYFPLEIQGRDGTVLCPVEKNTECNFWRGTLPLSQDYFITVRSGGDAENFTLRVAINPPGKTEQMFVYDTSKIRLSYSDQFAPANAPSVLNNKTNLQLGLQLIDTSSYVNTNLGEAYFVIGFSPDPQVVSTCTAPNPNGGAPEIPSGNVVFNGYNFAYSFASGAGAGNAYDQHIYRVVHNGACYEAIFFIHSSNIGNYPPGVVKEFDLDALLQKFNGILSTIQVK